MSCEATQNFFLFGPPLVGSLFFWSPSMIYIYNTTTRWYYTNTVRWRHYKRLMLQMMPPLLLRLLLLWLMQWVRVFPFSSVLTTAKRFLSIWIENNFWRWRDLNSQPFDLIHDESDHKTTVSCWKGFLFHVVTSGHLGMCGERERKSFWWWHEHVMMLMEQLIFLGAFKWWATYCFNWNMRNWWHLFMIPYLKP